MNEINIDEIKSFLRTQPVEKAWIFGSYARGTQTPDSDIDIIVKLDPHVKVGLFKFSQIALDLEAISKKKVDLVEDETLYNWMETNVSKEKILIYERSASR